MFCSNCGKKVEEGAKFCSACGQPVGNVEPSYNNMNYNRAQVTQTQTKTAMGSGKIPVRWQ